MDPGARCAACGYKIPGTYGAAVSPFARGLAPHARPGVVRVSKSEAAAMKAAFAENFPAVSNALTGHVTRRSTRDERDVYARRTRPRIYRPIGAPEHAAAIVRASKAIPSIVAAAFDRVWFGK